MEAMADQQLDATDQDGMTELMLACFKADSDRVSDLLQRGANPNIANPLNKYTALMFAVVSNCTNAVAQLIDAGVDVTARNNIGKTAKDIASLIGHQRCATLLRERMQQLNPCPRTAALDAAMSQIALQMNMGERE